MKVLNNKSRYQQGLHLGDIYPSIEGYCACGCNTPLTGRKKKWASRECNDRVYLDFAIIKGDTNIIRKELYKRDGGFCRECGCYSENWEADHIIPVKHGGGACGIDNFQTLCYDCHKEKTLYQMVSHRTAISSQEQVKVLMVCL